MRTILAIFILMSLFCCIERQTNNSHIQKNLISNNEKTLEITAINSKFPLRLHKINLENKDNTVSLNDGIVAKIEEVVKDFAKDFEFYDSSETYKDSYINTIRLHDSSQTIYLVLLKHYPTGSLNSSVLFYDNESKEFIDKKIDLNLWTLYNYDKGKINPTDLKIKLKISSPEIEIVDFNNDKINDYKIIRLYHNGTFNAIQTTILTVRNNKIDTLLFDEKHCSLYKRTAG